LAIAFISAFNDGDGFAASFTATAPQAYPAGTLFVVSAVAYDVASASISITDARGNSYSLVDAGGDVGGTTVRVFYSILTTAVQTSDLVTVTITSGGGGQVIIEAFSGLAASPFDQDDNSRDSVTPVTSHSSPSVTTTQADELLVGSFVWGAGGSGTYTPTNSFIVPTNGSLDPESFMRSVLEYKIVSSTGTYAATMDTSTNHSPRCGIVTFKAEAPLAEKQSFYVSRRRTGGRR
jgi:hypothetical protein